MPGLVDYWSGKDCGFSTDSWLPFELPTLSGLLALGTQAGLSRTVKSFAGWGGKAELVVERRGGDASALRASPSVHHR